MCLRQVRRQKNIFHDLNEPIAQRVLFPFNRNFLGHNLDQIVNDSHDLTIVVLCLVKGEIDSTVLQYIVNVVLGVIDGLYLLSESLVGFHFLGLRVLDHKVLKIFVESVVDEQHEIS